LTAPESLGHAIIGLLRRSLEIPVLISHVQIRLAPKPTQPITKKRASRSGSAKSREWLEKVAKVAAKVSLHAPVTIQDVSVVDKVTARGHSACAPHAHSCAAGTLLSILAVQEAHACIKVKTVSSSSSLYSPTETQYSFEVEEVVYQLMREGASPNLPPLRNVRRPSPHLPLTLRHVASQAPTPRQLTPPALSRHSNASS
jgi:hypothetical protein